MEGSRGGHSINPSRSTAIKVKGVGQKNLNVFPSLSFVMCGIIILSKHSKFFPRQRELGKSFAKLIEDQRKHFDNQIWISSGHVSGQW